MAWLCADSLPGASARLSRRLRCCSPNSRPNTIFDTISFRVCGTDRAILRGRVVHRQVACPGIPIEVGDQRFRRVVEQPDILGKGALVSGLGVELFADQASHVVAGQAADPGGWCGVASQCGSHGGSPPWSIRAAVRLAVVLRESTL